MKLIFLPVRRPRAVVEARAARARCVRALALAVLRARRTSAYSPPCVGEVGDRLAVGRPGRRALVRAGRARSGCGRRPSRPARSRSRRGTRTPPARPTARGSACGRTSPPLTKRGRVSTRSAATPIFSRCAAARRRDRRGAGSRPARRRLARRRPRRSAPGSRRAAVRRVDLLASPGRRRRG